MGVPLLQCLFHMQGRNGTVTHTVTCFPHSNILSPSPNIFILSFKMYTTKDAEPKVTINGVRGGGDLGPNTETEPRGLGFG